MEGWEEETGTWTPTREYGTMGYSASTPAGTRTWSAVGGGTAPALDYPTPSSQTNSLAQPSVLSQASGSFPTSVTQPLGDDGTQLHSILSTAAPPPDPLLPIKARVLKDTLSKHRRSLLLVRCAERVDRIFPDWLEQAFADDGTYQPYDLNFPQRLPVRPNGPLGFHNDPPITTLGEASAGLLGRGLRHRGIQPAFILSSPALRCVQTATEVKRCLGTLAPDICVEPGLMEPLGWYPSLPAFLSPDILASAGYPVSLHYKPLVKTEELSGLAGKETSDGAALRIRETLDCILAALGRQADKGMALVVGHAFTLDAGLRTLDAEAGEGMVSIGRGFLGLSYPYTSHLLLQEHLAEAASPTNANWTLISRHPKPIPTLTTFHFSNIPAPDLMDIHQTISPA